MIEPAISVTKACERVVANNKRLEALSEQAKIEQLNNNIKHVNRRIHAAFENSVEISCHGWSNVDSVIEHFSNAGYSAALIKHYNYIKQYRGRWPLGEYVQVKESTPYASILKISWECE